MTCSILLDYAVSFESVDPTNQASTAHLRNLGIVTQLADTPATGEITNEIGDQITPATIELTGFFAAGTIVDANFTSDVPFTGGAPYTLLADLPASELAILWANFISGIDMLTAEAKGNVIEVRAFNGGEAVSVTNYDQDDTGATPIPSQIVEVTSVEEISGYTDNADVIAAFDGGLNKVYLVLAAEAADIAPLIVGAECDFFTIYGSTDFLMSEYFSAFASFKGVKAASTNLQVEGNEVAVEANWCIFYEDTSIATEVRAYHGIFAFAKLLSANAWRNQQYTPVNPTLGSPVTSLGLADSLFNDRLSFYITDQEQGTRLSFFVAGGASITDPYIEEDLKINMQSDMLAYLSGTQPFNLLVNRLQLEQIGQAVIDDFLGRGYLDPAGENTLVITESNEAFKVYGELFTLTSEALWRVDVDAYQSVGV